MSQTKAQLVDAVDGSIVAADLASNSVTTAKVVDSAITADKLIFPVSNRNIIINGAMQVAQRGSASTATNGIQTADRFGKFTNSTDETPVQEQVDVASGTTPYTLGFRKAYKITNGNQTSGGSTTTQVGIEYKIEAQDLANSGWNYTSSSSFITFSFWCKSSVAQNFFCRILTADGSSQRYVIETGSLSADTWTKITKTIPGNSNLQFDNNNSEGLKISLYQFAGTSYTDSSSLNTWTGALTGNRTPDQTSTWYTTNDATFELTGVQLEVGSTATDFEHRSFGQELALCQRYFYALCDGANVICENATMYNSSSPFWSVPFPVEMRTPPSLEVSNSTNHFLKYENNGGTNFNTFSRDGITSTRIGSMNGSVSGTSGRSVMIRGNNASSKVHWSAEL